MIVSWYFAQMVDANIPPTARHKQICLETEVSAVPEIVTVENDFSG
jgi:hypothetical protein